jgi:hypothetical protein
MYWLGSFGSLFTRILLYQALDTQEYLQFSQEAGVSELQLIPQYQAFLWPLI